MDPTEGWQSFVMQNCWLRAYLETFHSNDFNVFAELSICSFAKSISILGLYALIANKGNSKLFSNDFESDQGRGKILSFIDIFFYESVYLKFYK